MTVKVLPANPEKSMMTSMRSAGAKNNLGEVKTGEPKGEEVGLAGAKEKGVEELMAPRPSNKPPSEPICRIVGAVRPLVLPAASARRKASILALQASRKRKRYLRGSTFR